MVLGEGICLPLSGPPSVISYSFICCIYYSLFFGNGEPLSLFSFAVFYCFLLFFFCSSAVLLLFSCSLFSFFRFLSPFFCFLSRAFPFYEWGDFPAKFFFRDFPIRNRRIFLSRVSGNLGTRELGNLGIREPGRLFTLFYRF